MYKAANNDTIVVVKDGYVLKFKMPHQKTRNRNEMRRDVLLFAGKRKLFLFLQFEIISAFSIRSL